MPPPRTEGAAGSGELNAAVQSMNGAAHHVKDVVFGLLDRAPMTPVRYAYWLLAIAFVSVGGLVATAAFAHVVDEEGETEETSDERPTAEAGS